LYHDDSGKLHGIKIDVAEQEVLRSAFQAPDDVPPERVATHAADVLGKASLTSAIQCGDAESCGDQGESFRPVARTRGVTMELNDGPTSPSTFGAKVLRMDAGPSCPLKPEIEAFDTWDPKISRNHPRIGGRAFQVIQGPSPIRIEVFGERAMTLIG
jgi:hypothetical protein